MKQLLVAGSREGVSSVVVNEFLDEWVEEHGVPDVVIHGAARGVDAHADDWARARGIPVCSFPTDWTRYGRAAGPRRNAEMAAVATHAVVIHHGSPGSRDMVKQAKRAKLKEVREHEVPFETWER